MSVLEADTAPVVSDPCYRPLALHVLRAERLSPSYLRLTLGGDDLAAFAAAGSDQRIKLVLPRAGVDWAQAPADWFGWWRALPQERRPVMRTYTVRAHRPGELDVDVVLHGIAADGTPTAHAGPAATWAAGARPGDPVVVLGPTAPGTGRMWGVEFAPPPAARSLLLAGDETAVPAVAAILEALPAEAVVTALLEVPHAGDIVALSTRATAEIQWLPRSGHRSAHGQLLAAAVRRRTAALRGVSPERHAVLEDVDVDTCLLWEVPDVAAAAGEDGLYCWLAGEAGTVRELRRHLVREVGLPRECVAFMGYWRAGRAEQ
ncbi:hypothetical protein NUM3379_37640 [Kineococcus sp. NUM-3379]